MKTTHNLMTRHPASVGETYAEHAGSAFGFAWRLQLAALAALVHAVLPFACEKTASTLVKGLYQRMLVSRGRHGATEPTVGTRLGG